MARVDGEAFLFYFERWRGSRPVQRMSMAERGVFFEMLIEQWIRGVLPDSAMAVAEAIAGTPAQAAEVDAAWPVVRRKFVTHERSGDIFNVEMDEIRRKRLRELRERKVSGSRGGKMKAQNALRTGELSVKQMSSSASQNPSKPLANPSKEGRKEGSNTEGSKEEREVPRAHHGTIFDGSLPREHLKHFLCDDTNARCVPEAVHAKFINALSPRYNGDRDAASRALSAWYRTVWAELPAEFVMGDAFKFWQGRFDAKLASAEAPKSKALLGTSTADMARGMAESLGLDPTKVGIPS